MRRRALWLVLVVLLLPTSARAHDHNADFYFAVCYANASHLGGPQVAVATTLPYKPLSVVVDFGRNYGSHEGRDLDWTTFMGGIRWMIAPREARHIPFVQALVGGGRISTRSFSETDESVSVGGGYEYIVHHDTKSTAWGLRVAADLVKTGDDWFKRVSAGAVLRIY